MKNMDLTSPPKPPLTFRVGVVGHRPNRLQGADLSRLGEVIGEILGAVEKAVRSFGSEHAALFSPAPPVLRAVSPLAEGADRLFAELALDRKWELCCVMPFQQAEFEKDFQPGTALEDDSLYRFHAILDRATSTTRLTCFQLDGSRADGAAAYAFCGHVVLNQSDLLVAVWDGIRQNKCGGTEEALSEARRRGVPVIWVDAHAPHAWQWIRSGLDLRTQEAERLIPDGSGTSESIPEVVRDLLA